MLTDRDWSLMMLIDADWFRVFWQMLTDSDWYWLVLIDADRCWLMLVDGDWWWLMLIDADWCWLIYWLMLIDAQTRFNRVFFCRSVPPELLRSFLKPVQMLQKVRHMDVPQKIPNCSTRWQETRVVCKKSSNTQGRSMSNTLRQASSQIQRGYPSTLQFWRLGKTTLQLDTD